MSGQCSPNSEMAYSFVVDGVVEVRVGRSAGVLDQSLLVGAVVLQSCPEQLGLSRLVVSASPHFYAT